MGTKGMIGMVVLMVATVIFMAGCNNAPEEGVKCVFCEMNVKLPETALGAKIVFNNEKEEYFCELGHAFKGWELETGGEADGENPPVGFYVVNYINKEIIAAQGAYYVFGSDVPSGMFAESTLVVGSKDQAIVFIKNHGGEVFTFDEIQHKNLTKMKMHK